MVLNITNYEAKQLLKEKVKIIDIREKDEFDIEHIKGSINVNINDLKLIEKIFPDKAQKIIVVCSKGIRSVAAAEELSSMGYIKVYNLMEGYDSYRHQ